MFQGGAEGQVVSAGRHGPKGQLKVEYAMARSAKQSGTGWFQMEQGSPVVEVVGGHGAASTLESPWALLPLLPLIGRQAAPP